MSMKRVIEYNRPLSPECNPRPPKYEVDLPTIPYVCTYMCVGMYGYVFLCPSNTGKSQETLQTDS